MTQADERYAEQIVATIAQPLLVLTARLEVEVVNSAFYDAFQVAPDEAKGRRLYDLGNGQWDIPELRRLLEEVLSQENEVRNYRVEHEFGRLGRRIMRLNARRMRREGADDRILLAIDDITEAERQRHELEGRKEFAEKLVDSVREGLIVLGWDLCVRSANQSFYDQFRVRREETEGRKLYDLGNGQWAFPDCATSSKGFWKRNGPSTTSRSSTSSRRSAAGPCCSTRASSTIST